MGIRGRPAKARVSPQLFAMFVLVVERKMALTGMTRRELYRLLGTNIRFLSKGAPISQLGEDWLRRSCMRLGFTMEELETTGMLFPKHYYDPLETHLRMYRAAREEGAQAGMRALLPLVVYIYERLLNLSYNPHLTFEPDMVKSGSLAPAVITIRPATSDARVVLLRFTHTKEPAVEYIVMGAFPVFHAAVTVSKDLFVKLPKLVYPELEEGKKPAEDEDMPPMPFDQPPEDFYGPRTS